MNAEFTTRGTVRKYRRWPVPGLPRGVRERIERRERILAGFTARGGVRRARLTGWLNGLAGRERRNAWLGLRRQANYALGRTARGTPRKMFTKPRTVTL